MSDQKPQQRPEHPTSLEKLADRIMHWAGSIQSLVVHSIFFAASFSLILFGFEAATVLLVVTTVVSLEAIYMAIFIQMAVNKNTQSLDAVEEDIDEIQEDVEEIQEDVEEIQEDVDEIEKDVDEIGKDIDEIQKDVDEIEKDIDVIEKDIPDDASPSALNRADMDMIEQRLVKLLSQLERMKDGPR